MCCLTSFSSSEQVGSMLLRILRLLLCLLQARLVSGKCSLNECDQGLLNETCIVNTDRNVDTFIVEMFLANGICPMYHLIPSCVVFFFAVQQTRDVDRNGSFGFTKHEVCDVH